MNFLLKDRDAGWRFEKAFFRDKPIHFTKTTPFMVTFGEVPLTKFDINTAIELGLRVVRFRMTAVTESDKIRLVSLLNKSVSWCCEKYNVSTWPIALSADVPNACIRTGYLENKKEHPEGIMLKEDSIVEVTSNVEYLNKCNANRIFIDDPYTVPCLVPGTEITISFGSVVMISIEKINDQNVKCKVISEGMINDQSFVCVRGIIHIKPALTERDLEIIEFAKSLKFDIITINSVRIARTLRRVRAMTISYKPLLMGVICEQEGLDNIDSIIEASDGIILAGEFLIHEIKDKYKIITIQLYVSAKCRLVGKPLYLSGQILQNALFTGESTISDISDITNAILQRSGFTLRRFKDPANLIKALRTLDDVCQVVEPLTRYDHQHFRLSMEHKVPVNAARAAVLSAVFLAKVTHAMVIIVPTVTGRTIKQVTHMSADITIIIAITSCPTVAKQLQLHKGVIPIVYDKKPLKDWQEEMDVRIKFAVAYALKFKVLYYGSTYVLLRKTFPTTSYCDQVCAFKVLTDEDVVRMECTRKTGLRVLDWDISKLPNTE